MCMCMYLCPTHVGQLDDSNNTINNYDTQGEYTMYTHHGKEQVSNRNIEERFIKQAIACYNKYAKQATVAIYFAESNIYVPMGMDSDGNPRVITAYPIENTRIERGLAKPYAEAKRKAAKRMQRMKSASKK